ncbi:MAG: hypothetical protein ACREPZ_14435 [Rhodanobacteraceae bacterium]
MAAYLQSMVNSERSAVRHALAAERVRAGRCRAALARAKAPTLRARCRRKLDAIFGRAAKLALTLVDMGEAVPVAQAFTDFDGRLLDAMDLVLRKRSRQSTAVYACVRPTVARGGSRIRTT